MSATTRRVFGGNKAAVQPIHPSKQRRQNPNQQFEGSEEYDYVVDRKTGWKMVVKSSRETCRMLRLRRPHHGRIPHGKIGIHGGGIVQSLTKSSERLFFFEEKKHAVSDCRNVVPTNRRGVYTEYTPAALHHEQHSLLTSTDMKCVLMAQGTNCSIIFVRINTVCHKVSHVIFLLVSTSPSLFQSTTRSTTWTARPPPRRHCTWRTSSKNYMVGKQR